MWHPAPVKMIHQTRYMLPQLHILDPAKLSRIVSRQCSSHCFKTVSLSTTQANKTKLNVGISSLEKLNYYSTCIHDVEDPQKDQSPERVLCQKLSHRGLVRVAGQDATAFLQGLITNDMRCLEGTADCRGMGKQLQVKVQSLYAMMLNVKGRLLYDLIVYNMAKNNDQPSYLIEVNSDVLPDFMKALKMYKIRKKVDLVNVSNELSVCAVIPENSAERSKPLAVALKNQSDVVTAVSDPRLRSFSHRLVVPNGVSGSDVMANSQEVADESVYHRRRHQWGIGEGTVDHPPGDCLPLECNAVFLNAVSFNKGCYIGQELTARTHHTGVIRKRLMPIMLKSEAGKAQPGDKVENTAGKNCGKFRSREGRHGLALLRLGDVIGQGDLVIKDSDGEVVEKNVTTHIPHWWPRDSDEIIKQILSERSRTVNAES